MFGDCCMHSVAACCKQIRSTSQGIIKRMQQRASKKQLLFVPPCIEKCTGERKVAFRSLLVQVETGQMSAAETGQMYVVPESSGFECQNGRAVRHR